ncbi:cytochrome P450 oxidoreductase [Xylariaceae sp. FL0255]|nr:cytochrome P450 oxidoreductase [Xylariaceae sp. FL0255]
MSVDNLTAVAIGAIGIYNLLQALLRLTQDAREPRLIENIVPYLSPIFGMRQRGFGFYKYLRDKHKLPIYTLRLPGSRMYIVNDTSLIPVIQRQTKIISISPIMVRVFSHFMGVSKQALEIRLQTIEGINPGPNLDDLVTRAVGYLDRSLSATIVKNPLLKVDLFEWVSQEIMLATTNAIYGVRNPFKNREVQAAYKVYEASLATLMTGLLPAVMVKQSLEARSIIVEAFVKYYDEGGVIDESSSVYAKNRHNYPSELGIPLRDIATMETGGSIGLISNTMPATSWTIYHIFSDTDLLRECRRELKGGVTEKDGQRYVDISYVKGSCPLLLATMQEVFRFHSIGMSARAVVEDHVLGGKFQLKKGATLLIPSNVQHSSSEAWGPDYNLTAFRAFGGGANLCPGRHFATTEILAFASIVLLRFDMAPTGGRWSTMGYKETNAALRLPNRDVTVELVPRDIRECHIVLSAPDPPRESTKRTNVL